MGIAVEAAGDGPAGVGSRNAILLLDDEERVEVLTRGAAWAVGYGNGRASELERCEEGGGLAWADSEPVSAKGDRQRLGRGRHARLGQPPSSCSR